MTKEEILEKIETGELDIFKQYKELYGSELEEMVDELTISYNFLVEVMKKNEKVLSDAHLQSVLFFWGGLNTLLAIIQLLFRGYEKEPMMLMRNTIELFATSFDISTNPDRYQAYIADPNKFKSTKSIDAAKKIFPILGSWNGSLSDFVHVKGMHALPHHPMDGLIAGGVFDPNEQRYMKLRVYMILGTIDVLNALLEFSFLKITPGSRYWRKRDEENADYLPNKERTERVLQAVGEQVKKLQD